jgi:predicted enzyme related to lactoylglutathione lyase
MAYRLQRARTGSNERVPAPTRTCRLPPRRDIAKLRKIWQAAADHRAVLSAAMKHHPLTAALYSIALLAATQCRVFAKPLPADVGPGRVAWFDLTTSNLTQSKNFYGKLFDWAFEPVQGTDQAAEIVAGGRSIGTLRTADGKISSFNGVVYIQVSDLVKSCKDAKELGGTIPAGFPFNLPEGRGAIAIVHDPAGHPVGLYSRTPL